MKPVTSPEREGAGLTFAEWERIRPPHCAFCSRKDNEDCASCLLDGKPSAGRAALTSTHLKKDTP